MPIDEVQIGSTVAVYYHFINPDDDTAVDLTGMTIVGYLKPPDSGTLKNISSIAIDGNATLGIGLYTLATTDIDVEGAWETQAKATISSSVYYSERVHFQAVANLS
jgi:hypothetical protein